MGSRGVRGGNATSTELRVPAFSSLLGLSRRGNDVVTEIMNFGLLDVSPGSLSRRFDSAILSAMVTSSRDLMRVVSQMGYTTTAVRLTPLFSVYPGGVLWDEHRISDRLSTISRVQRVRARRRTFGLDSEVSMAMADDGLVTYIRDADGDKLALDYISSPMVPIVLEAVTVPGVEGVKVSGYMCYNKTEYVLGTYVSPERGVYNWMSGLEPGYRVVSSYGGSIGSCDAPPSFGLRVRVVVNRGVAPPIITKHASASISSRSTQDYDVGQIMAGLYKCKTARYQGGRTLPGGRAGMDARSSPDAWFTSVMSFVVFHDGVVGRVVCECRHGSTTGPLDTNELLAASMEGDAFVAVTLVSIMTYIPLWRKASSNVLRPVSAPRAQAYSSIVESLRISYPYTVGRSSSVIGMMDALCDPYCTMYTYRDDLIDANVPGLVVDQPSGRPCSGALYTMALKGAYVDGLATHASVRTSACSREATMTATPMEPRGWGGLGIRSWFSAPRTTDSLSVYDLENLGFTDEALMSELLDMDPAVVNWHVCHDDSSSPSSDLARAVTSINMELLCTDSWSGVSLLRLDREDSRTLTSYLMSPMLKVNYGGVELNDVIHIRSSTLYKDYLNIGLQAIRTGRESESKFFPGSILTQLNRLLGPIIDPLSNIRLPTRMISRCEELGLTVSRFGASSAYDASDVIVRWTLSQLFLSESLTGGTLSATYYDTHLEMLARYIPPCVARSGVHFYAPSIYMFDYLWDLLTKSHRRGLAERVAKRPDGGLRGSQTEWLFTIKSGALVVDDLTASDTMAAPYIVTAGAMVLDVRPLVLDAVSAMAAGKNRMSVMWCSSFSLMLYNDGGKFSVIIASPSRVSSIITLRDSDLVSELDGHRVVGRSRHVPLTDEGYVSSVGLNVYAKPYAPRNRTLM
jgi:hypothetical protein